MKIGVLGGSFDPPHNGHLKLAETAEKMLGLDLVLFVPCSTHKLKGRAPASSPFHRANMVALAIQSKKNWLVETVELEKGGFSFTSETLEYLHEKYRRSRFYFILGEDSYAEIHRWKNPEMIRKLATLTVFPRGIDGTDTLTPGDILMDMKKVDVSSSGLRKMIASGKKPSGLLSRQVWEYIQKHLLYL